MGGVRGSQGSTSPSAAAQHPPEGQLAGNGYWACLKGLPWTQGEPGSCSQFWTDAHWRLLPSFSPQAANPKEYNAGMPRNHHPRTRQRRSWQQSPIQQKVPQTVSLQQLQPLTGAKPRRPRSERPAGRGRRSRGQRSSSSSARNSHQQRLQSGQRGGGHWPEEAQLGVMGKGLLLASALLGSARGSLSFAGLRAWNWAWKPAALQAATGHPDLPIGHNEERGQASSQNVGSQKNVGHEKGKLSTDVYCA